MTRGGLPVQMDDGWGVLPAETLANSNDEDDHADHPHCGGGAVGAGAEFSRG